MKKLLALAMFTALPALAIDLNTATVEEIAALKGMTQQTAEAIVSTRTQNGPFQSSSDVLNVPGVTQGMLNQNRATLTIAGRPVTTRSGTAPAIPGVRPAIPAKKADTTVTTTSKGKTSGQVSGNKSTSGKSTAATASVQENGKDSRGNSGNDGGRGNSGGNGGGNSGGNGGGGGNSGGGGGNK